MVAQQSQSPVSEVPREWVEAVRAFNRFYTGLIGLLEAGMYDTDYTLGEARVIYEVGRRPGITAGDLAGKIDMDPGQLSRLLRRLAEAGEIESIPGRTDGRVRELRPTEKGRATFARFDAASNAQIAEMLGGLPAGRQPALISAMTEIETAFGGPAGDGEVVFRPPRIGELGWLIHRQALLYNQEYGWNAEFEGLIAGIYRDYEASEDETKALFIAEINGAVAGSVFILPAEEPGVAKLRMLYVEPFARGRGLGHQLVARAVAFSRDAGYARIVLWTQDCLTAARRVYQRAGFTLVEEERHESFGADLNGQYWAMDLAGPGGGQ